MLRPEMITNCIKPFNRDKNIKATVLAMNIIGKDQYFDPNIVKLFMMKMMKFYILLDHQFLILKNSIKVLEQKEFMEFLLLNGRF